MTARSIDLTVAGYEPRGAIDADLLFGDRVLRVIATHFGLHAGERRLQANRLMAALGETPDADRREADAVLLMGDLNEWRGRSGAIRTFDRRLGPSPAERTFPSWMPVLALDRIYADRAGGAARRSASTAPRSPGWLPTICRWSANLSLGRLTRLGGASGLACRAAESNDAAKAKPLAVCQIGVAIAAGPV